METLWGFKLTYGITRWRSTRNESMGNMGNLGAIANMMGGNMGGGNLGAPNNVSGDTSMDPIVTMILSLRNFVDPQRARFLDKVLKMYKEGKITY